MSRSRLVTIGIAVAAAAILLPRLQAAAAKNKDGFLAKLISP